MITDEGRRKLFITSAVFIIAAIIVVVIFSLFFSNGTLVLVSTPPYTVQVDSRTIDCTLIKCSIQLQPGAHQLLLQKEGHKDLSLFVNAQIFKSEEKKIDFDLIPYVTSVTQADFNQAVPKPKLSQKDLDTLGVKQVWFDGSNFAYLKNEDTDQRLYVSSQTDSGFTDPVLAAVFKNPIKTFYLVPNLSSNQKVALIDSSSGYANLYIIDLKAKTRLSYLNLPSINQATWTNDGKAMLLDAKEDGEIANALYTFYPDSRQLNKLNFYVSLNDVISLPNQRLIYLLPDADNKNVQVMDGDLETLSFEQAKTLAVPLPQNIYLSADAKGIYFQSGSDYYDLHVAD